MGQLDALASNILVVEPAAGLPAQQGSPQGPNQQAAEAWSGGGGGWGEDEGFDDDEGGWGGDDDDLDLGDNDDDYLEDPKEPTPSPPRQQLVSQGSHAFTDIALDSPTPQSPRKDGVEGSGGGAVTASRQQADASLVSAADLAKARKDNAALRRTNAELKRRAAAAEKVP